MSKKKIAIIVAAAIVAVLAVVAVAAVYLTQQGSEEQQDSNANNTSVSYNTNVNRNATNDVVGAYNETTTNLNNENTSSNSNVNANNENIGTAEDDGVYPKTGTDRYAGYRSTRNENGGEVVTSYSHEFDDEQLLANVDQEKLKNDTVTFVNNFFNYDASSVQGYQMSWAQNVASSAYSDKSGLIYQHASSAWQSACATYNELYSHVNSCSANTVYVSRYTDGDENGNTGTIAVSLTLNIDRNQADPGEFDWQIVNSYTEKVAVYYNTNLQITSVKVQSSKTLNYNIFNYEMTSGSL